MALAVANPLGVPGEVLLPTAPLSLLILRT